MMVSERQQPVHLEGFGLVGTMAAWTLYRAGIPFTWQESHERTRAWEASSGLIYPSGSDIDTVAYMMWERWANGKAPWRDEPKLLNVTERGSFWYASKSAPNGSTAPHRADIGILRCSSLPSYHLDVPAFVLRTRRVFRSLERTFVPGGSRLVVAHGYNKYRLDHLVWGWTADVKLTIDPQFLRLCGSDRPTFYLRQGRFKFGYANPRPGNPTWIAGSSHIPQDTAKSYEMESKYANWLDFFNEMTAGLVKVQQLSDCVDGWRPAPDSDDKDLGWLERDGVLYAPSLGGNGVRYAPYFCADLLSKVRRTQGVQSAV